MKHRTSTLRIASERKQRQIKEVQYAKNILLREQKERIEEETRKNEIHAEQARRGIDRIKQIKIEEAKEKHIQERQRAIQNIERSKNEIETDKKRLEKEIIKKTKRTEEIKKVREKVIFLILKLN
jgi:hypothetical protein